MVNGHDHDYERTFAVRGYDAGTLGTVVAPNPSQTAAGQVAGTAVDTRRSQHHRRGRSVPDGRRDHDVLERLRHQQGHGLFLTLGWRRHRRPDRHLRRHLHRGRRRPRVITTRNQIYVERSNGNYTRNGADSVEPAPWSAQRDTVDAYGYATFAVDPGTGPGRTTITMTYFHAPQASGGAVGLPGHHVVHPVRGGRLRSRHRERVAEPGAAGVRNAGRRGRCGAGARGGCDGRPPSYPRRGPGCRRRGRGRRSPVTD